MEALQQCVVKLTRNSCPLTDAGLQGHLELMIQLSRRVVECLPKDGQFVISTDIDFVPKIAARQRFCANGEFGERESNSSGNVPPERGGHEQSQPAGRRHYYEKTRAHLLGLLVHCRPLLKYSFLHALHQRRTEIDQILDLSRQSELNSRPIAHVRQFNLTVNLRGQSRLESFQGA